MIRKSIPSSMNGMKRLKNPPLFISTQHYSSRSQYAAYGGRCHLSRLSSILRVTHAQEIAHCRAYWQSWKFVDCACKSHDLEMAHVCYAISRLAVHAAISRFERNFRILRMHNTILRLHKFSDCVEQFHSQTVRAPIGGAPYKYAKERDGPFLSVSTLKHEKASISCRQRFDALEANN